MNSGGNWYPDPQNPALLRWWNGSSWTESTQPNPAAAGAPANPGGWNAGAGGLAAPASGSWQPGAPVAPPTPPQFGVPVAPTAQYGAPVPPGTAAQPGYPGFSAYPGGPGQPPRKSGGSKTIWGIAGAALILVVIIIVVIAVSAHGTKSTPTANGGPTTGTSTQQPTPTASPASSPTAGSTSAATGSGYAAYQFTDVADNNYVYKVTLMTIDENASDSIDTPDPGTHFVGVEFSILGVSGNDDGNDDAFNCASVQGSDGKTYNGVFAQINDGNSFNSGAFGPAPGATVTGWIPFELPNGVTVVSVQWQDDEPAEPALWKVH
jgi:hypothetical protein